MNNKGLNTKTGQVEELVVAGIVDTADVVLGAVKNAIGVAASVLTAGSVITLPREDVVPQNPSILPR